MVKIKNNKIFNNNIKQKNHQNADGGVVKKLKNVNYQSGKDKVGKKNLIKSQVDNDNMGIKKKQFPQKKMMKKIPSTKDESESDNDEEMSEVASDQEMCNDPQNDSDDEEENDDEIEEGEQIVEKSDDDKMVTNSKIKAKNNSNAKNKSNVDDKHKPREHKIMVNNLPMDTTFPDILKLFSDSGAIEKVILSNPETFEFGLKNTDSLRAIIIFKNYDSIAKALQYNDNEFKGRQILLTTNNIKPSYVPQKQNTIRFQPNVSIFIRNIKPGTTEEQIKKFFSSCGEVKYIEIKENGQASVRFSKTQSVQPALKLNKTTLNDSKVLITRYMNSSAKTIKQKLLQPSPLNILIKKMENKIMVLEKKMNIQNEE